METLKNIRVEYIGDNINEWRVIFILGENETEETMCFYRGMPVKLILAVFLHFTKTIMHNYL